MIKSSWRKWCNKTSLQASQFPCWQGKEQVPWWVWGVCKQKYRPADQTEVERKNMMNHIFPSMNRIVSPSVDESCTLPRPRRKESGERTEDASHKWRLPSSTFVTRSLPLSQSFQWTVTNCSCRSEMYPYLRSAASFTACNHSQCETNRVKWSRQIMQSGHGVNCQWETAFTSPTPAAWKYHAAVMASCLPETW